jgi:hypothetical protein
MSEDKMDKGNEKIKNKMILSCEELKKARGSISLFWSREQK